MKKEMTYEEMWHEAKALDIADTCWNKVSTYAFEHSSGCYRSRYFDKMWSKREDVVHVMPWGIEVDRATNEYNRPELDAVYDADELNGESPFAKGGLMLHSITTPVVEVADDLQSCRLAFRSPGHETCVWPVNADTLEYSKEWTWSGYGFDFILEDNDWRVLNMRVIPVFKCVKDESWATAPAMGEDLIESIVKQLPAGTIPAPHLFQYTGDVIVPYDEPEPPVPYGNLEKDTKHTEIGCGYAAVHGDKWIADIDMGGAK